MEGSKLLA